MGLRFPFFFPASLLIVLVTFCCHDSLAMSQDDFINHINSFSPEELSKMINDRRHSLDYESVRQNNILRHVHNEAFQRAFVRLYNEDNPGENNFDPYRVNEFLATNSYNHLPEEKEEPVPEPPPTAHDAAQRSADHALAMQLQQEEEYESSSSSSSLGLVVPFKNIFTVSMTMGPRDKGSLNFPIKKEGAQTVYRNQLRQYGATGFYKRKDQHKTPRRLYRLVDVYALVDISLEESGDFYGLERIFDFVNAINRNPRGAFMEFGIHLPIEMISDISIFKYRIDFRRIIKAYYAGELSPEAALGEIADVMQSERLNLDDIDGEPLDDN